MTNERMLKLAETIEKHGLCLTIAHLPTKEELALEPVLVAWLREKANEQNTEN